MGHTEEGFQTRDVSMAAAISLLSGKNPQFKSDRKGSVVFIFEDSDEVRRIAEDYVSGEAVGSLFEFAERNRSIRNRMFNAADLNGRRNIPAGGGAR